MKLPKNFKQDLQVSDTNLIPLVVFNDLSPYLFISTNNISLDIYFNIVDSIENPHFKPILLNIPSISQSVDFESKKFKISNVSLSISNYEYEGKRFSDLLESTSMINQEVSIYWKSPSSKNIFHSSSIENLDMTQDEFYESDEGDETCPNIYTGKIRRISHDTENVKLELEDLT